MDLNTLKSILVNEKITEENRIYGLILDIFPSSSSDRSLVVLSLKLGSIKYFQQNVLLDKTTVELYKKELIKNWFLSEKLARKVICVSLFLTDKIDAKDFAKLYENPQVEIGTFFDIGVSFSAKNLFAQPKIISFNSNVVNFKDDDEVTLSWDINNADKVTLLGFGEVTKLKEYSVNPAKKTKYVIRAENAFFKAEKELIISPLPLIVKKITADKDVCIGNSEVTLNWQIENAKEIIISDVGSVLGLSQTQVHLEEEDKVFSFTANGHCDQVIQKFIQIKIAKIYFFSVKQTVSEENVSFFLHWKTRKVEYVEINNGVGQIQDPSYIEIPSSSVPIRYTISGYTKYGEVLKEHLDLIPATIVYFRSDTLFAYHGQEFEISWNILNVKKVWLNNGIGEVPNKGKRKLIANKDTSIYKITGLGEINQITESLSIQVLNVPRIEMLQIPFPDINFTTEDLQIKPSFHNRLSNIGYIGTFPKQFNTTSGKLNSNILPRIKIKFLGLNLQMAKGLPSFRLLLKKLLTQLNKGSITLLL